MIPDTHVARSDLSLDNLFLPKEDGWIQNQGVFCLVLCQFDTSLSHFKGGKLS